VTRRDNSITILESDDAIEPRPLAHRALCAAELSDWLRTVLALGGILGPAGDAMNNGAILNYGGSTSMTDATTLTAARGHSQSRRPAGVVLFEISAEVLGGLVTACEHYDQKREPA
jgi:hypothetical protein